MARRDARRPRRQRNRYEEYDSYDDRRRPRPRQRRSGCLAPVKSFFRNVAIVLLVAIGAIIFFVVVLLIAFHFALFIQVMVYVFWIALVLFAIWIIYLAVCMISAISERMSQASERKARAKIANRRADIEQERVHQAQLQVEAQEAKLAQSAYSFYEKQQQYHSPRRTRNFREEEGYEEESRRRTRVFQEEEPLVMAAEEDFPEPVEEPQTELEALGMPSKGQVFPYKDYRKFLKPGQLIIGIRADGTARIGSWQDFKIMLILGASSSGKSTTVLEKCLCIVNQTGLLVVCDPGGFKPDSLIQRIGSMADAIMPGTSLAIEHEDIMANVARFEQELERRRRGADMTTSVLLVIDELNGLLMDKEIKKELTELIEKFAQQARGYNMYMILCAQRSSGLAAIRNSVISFVCHKCPEMEAAKIIPGRYAKLAPQLGVGQTFVSDADGFLEPLQQTLLSPQDIEERAAQHRPRTTKTLHSRQTEPAPQPARIYGAPAAKQRQEPIVLQVPESAPSPQPPHLSRTSPKIPRRPTVPTGNPPLVPQHLQKQTVQLSEARHAASAVWGQPAEQALDATPRQTILPRRLVAPLSTEELRPPSPPRSTTTTDALDEFDALAALRDERQQKKK